MKNQLTNSIFISGNILCLIAFVGFHIQWDRHGKLRKTHVALTLMQSHFFIFCCDSFTYSIMIMLMNIKLLLSSRSWKKKRSVNQQRHNREKEKNAVLHIEMMLVVDIVFVRVELPMSLWENHIFYHSIVFIWFIS